MLSFEDEADGSFVLVTVAKTGRGVLLSYQKEEVWTRLLKTRLKLAFPN